MLDMQDTNCLIDTTSYNKELSFCGGYVDGLVTHLDNWLIEGVDM